MAVYTVYYLHDNPRTDAITLLFSVVLPTAAQPKKPRLEDVPDCATYSSKICIYLSTISRGRIFWVIFQETTRKWYCIHLHTTASIQSKWIGWRKWDGEHNKFIKDVFSDTRYNVCEQNTQVECFTGLVPLHYTSNIRPDVCVYYKSGDDEELPLVTVEVHSSPFEDTIRKTVLVVATLLHYHCVYNPKRKKCVGFLFPKLCSVSHTKKESVGKVEVTWSGCFYLNNDQCVPWNSTCALVYQLYSVSYFVFLKVYRNKKVN